MTEKKSSSFYLSLGLTVTLLIFLLDLVLPLGVASGTLYVAVVLIGFMARSNRLILFGALVGTALTIIALPLSPSGGELWKILTNRFLGIGIIWLTATLCLRQYRIQQKLQVAHDQLGDRVDDRTSELNRTNVLLKREGSFLQLNKDIAVISNEPTPVEETMRTCLEKVCHHANWPVGHIYLADRRDSDHLVPTTIWYLDDPEHFETFRKITESTPLDLGIGLPGRVLSSGKPAWIIDVTKDPNFPRAKLAENIGVIAGFAFPILIGKSVAGVMEFFSAQAVEPDKEMLATMANVGTLFGRVIERKWAEEDQEKILHSLRERVKELTTLYGVANLVETSDTMKEIFEKVESCLISGFLHPKHTRVKIVFQDVTYWSEPFMPSPWKIMGEILIQGKREGTLEVFYMKPKAKDMEDPFLQEERYLVDTVSRLLSVASERRQAEEETKQSHEQLRDLYRRMDIVREEERTRIAREVHDELAQGLTALKLELSLLDKKLNKAAPKLQPKAQMMMEMIDSILPGIKKLIIDLRPPILDDLGLADVIEWQGKDFENRTGVRFQFDHGDQKVNLSPGRATTLFRIFQETLTNITRHAQAKNIHVSLVQSNGTVTLKVVDDGRGITKKEISNSKSFGLLGMRERALVWGGNISITGKPKKGTSVTIKLDCQDSKDSALPEKTS